MAGIPGLETTRSVSRNFSQVTAVFKENVDLYFARQQVSERLEARDACLKGSAADRPRDHGAGRGLHVTVDFANPAEGRKGRTASPAGSRQRFLTPEGERLTMRPRGLRTVQIDHQSAAAPSRGGQCRLIGGFKQYLVEPDR